MADIGMLTSSDAVKQAIAECDELGRAKFLKTYGFGTSRRYPLVYERRIYDSKAIAGVAYGYQHGTFLTRKDFSGGEKTVVPVLEALGFTVESETGPASWLVKGRTYFRKDLTARFGGQVQAGIWTPRDFPAVLLFSGDSGAAFGYKDGWTDEGVFQYTGEGQTGDMTFVRGNAAIRDHRQRGKDLFLFTEVPRGNAVRYEGMFECIGWDDTRKGPDRNGTLRNIIVFDLLPVESTRNIAGTHSPRSGSKTLDELRSAAYAAFEASKVGGKSKGTARTWYLRSERVREYVLARAGGTCECCERDAPFQDKAGHPYLEPHHTTRLADDGPDHPEHVAAVCPNCHRHIHSGADGAEVNARLKKTVREKEKLIAGSNPAG